MNNGEARLVYSVSRLRLLRLLDMVEDRLVVLAAASGWGKTVTAKQFSEHLGRDSVVWLSASGRTYDEESLLRELISRLGGSVRESVLLPPANTTDLHALFRDSLSASPTAITSIVLDDLDLAVLWPALPRIAQALEETLSSTSKLIVTSRWAPSTEPLPVSGWLIDESDLRFEPEEALEVVKTLTGIAPSDAVVAELMGRSCGHPAVLCMLARHPELRLGEEVLPPLELRSKLQELVHRALSEAERLVLYAMMLLQTASAADIDYVVGTPSASAIGVISRTLPLVTVMRPAGSAPAVSVHDLAVSALAHPDALSIDRSVATGVRGRALRVLERRGEYERLLAVVEQESDTEALAHWLDRIGERALDQGHAVSISALLEQLPPSSMIRSPSLLLVSASCLGRAGQIDEAKHRAKTAGELASVDGDERLVAKSLLLRVRLATDAADMEAMSLLLSQLVQREDQLSEDDQALVRAFLTVVHGQRADTVAALEAAERASRLAARESVGRDARAYCAITREMTRSQVHGLNSEVVAGVAGVANDKGLSVTMRIMAAGNLAVSLCEIGRVERAAAVVGATLSLCDQYCLPVFGHAFRPIEAALHAAAGDYARCEREMDVAIRGSYEAGDNYSAGYNRIYRATCRRAAGDGVGALEDAERAVETLVETGSRVVEWLAGLELAAGLLFLGDEAEAVRRANAVRKQADPRGMNYHSLRADLILAEHSRRVGHAEDGTVRLIERDEYIVSGSSNWQIAMYIRAFPGLLGMIAEAVGVRRLPVHLVRLLLPCDVERGLSVGREYMRPEVWRELAVRLLGEDRVLQLECEESQGSTCRVRLFGGLEVRTEHGLVSEKAWRKRKARQMFAMLVVRKGQDVPREQLFDILWPDMTEERARNNFYVAWNAMKTALMAGEGKREACPYVEAVGGVCRVLTQTVTSDLEEFEQLIATARAADDEGDRAAALEAYGGLVEVYRGDLLPGDVYDDWFAALRDRCRQEFGDAMLRASELLIAMDNAPRALAMVRCALSHDPWREDLYQATIRCQVALGQRSAAIDTYFACRQRLAEDLGLDPSVGTRRLYEELLAMEDGPSPLEGPEERWA